MRNFIRPTASLSTMLFPLFKASGHRPLARFVSIFWRHFVLYPIRTSSTQTITAAIQPTSRNFSCNARVSCWLAAITERKASISGNLLRPTSTRLSSQSFLLQVILKNSKRAQEALSKVTGLTVQKRLRERRWQAYPTRRKYQIHSEGHVWLSSPQE